MEMVMSKGSSMGKKLREICTQNGAERGSGRASIVSQPFLRKQTIQYPGWTTRVPGFPDHKSERMPGGSWTGRNEELANVKRNVSRKEKEIPSVATEKLEPTYILPGRQ